MDITCIIPVYNRRGLVGDAIRSVMEQDTSLSVETVVVDDGSADGTPQYIRDRFPHVKLVETGRNLGPGAARNAGARHASGEVLMFLDSDDRWLPSHASMLFEAIRHGADVAYGITCTIDETTGSSFLIPEEGQHHSGNCYEHLLHWCFLVPSSIAVTRQAFIHAGGFSNIGFGEDWHFFLKLGRDFAFSFISETITHRLLHRGSLCASGNISKKICMMLESLLEDAKNRADRAAEERFRILSEHAAHRGEQWNTVQDWYTSLKRHGLV